MANNQQTEDFGPYVAQEAGNTYASSILLIAKLKKQNSDLLIALDGERKDKDKLLAALKKDKEALEKAQEVIEAYEGGDDDELSDDNAGPDQADGAN
mgnify:CR=1 FL=1